MKVGYSVPPSETLRWNWNNILARSKETSASSKSLILIAFVLAMTALYFGRQLFIPLALAVVFTFLLTPLVTLLEKIHFSRVPAVLPCWCFLSPWVGLSPGVWQTNWSR